ncbi:hypothetical protein E2C01_040695 [Portunus trituberculatus]|uniref:Uncharacterized protein n=1 Tax=Portunus trituberculatus TaxID=210409 RepID=A0A5B7FKH2_PORTR|nr:hypothetical protein [Portunus trituberculatus]
MGRASLRYSSSSSSRFSNLSTSMLCSSDKEDNSSGCGNNELTQLFETVKGLSCAAAKLNIVIESLKSQLNANVVELSSGVQLPVDPALLQKREFTVKRVSHWPTPWFLVRNQEHYHTHAAYVLAMLGKWPINQDQA